MADEPRLQTSRVEASATSFPALRLQGGELWILEGPGTGRRFVMGSGGARLGKGPDNDLVLEDHTVSQHHAEIRETPEGLLLRDLQSTNGTFLENRRVREAYLTPGCHLKLGSTVLRFDAPGARLVIAPSARDRFGRMRGNSPKMRQIFGILEKVAPTETSVLVNGETGTGKEVLARSIHEESSRANGPFVVFDGSAVSRDLIESSLFGHREGAFTGASGSRKGAFLAANGGTIFIDEIGELPLDMQPRFLRVLEMRQVQPLGTDVPIDIDVRIVAATHRNLRKMVKDGQFRQDLYYRLSVVTLELPPLRDRLEDLSLLVEDLLRAAGRKNVTVPIETIRELAGRRWEGNVRELKNVIERGLIFAGDGDLMPAHISSEELTPEGAPAPASDLLAGDKSLEEVEAQVILATLRRHGWNKTQASKVLGITRKTLLDKIEKYKLE